MLHSARATWTRPQGPDCSPCPPVIGEVVGHDTASAPDSGDPVYLSRRACPPPSHHAGRASAIMASRNMSYESTECNTTAVGSGETPSRLRGVPRRVMPTFTPGTRANNPPPPVPWGMGKGDVRGRGCPWVTIPLLHPMLCLTSGWRHQPIRILGCSKNKW